MASLFVFGRQKQRIGATKQTERRTHPICMRRGAGVSAIVLTAADGDESTVMTATANGHEYSLHIGRLYKTYVELRLTPQEGNGLRTIPVAHFGTFEVRLIEFAGSNRQDSFDLWIELYRHDTQSSIDSCLCRNFDEVEDLGEYFISQARGLGAEGHCATGQRR